MIKLTVLLTASLLVNSCARFAATPNPYRSISSIEGQLAELSVEEVQQEMSEKFEKMVFVTLSAYESLSHFDQHLENTPGLLEDNPHYPELLASRAQLEEIEDEIFELRDQFYRAALNPQFSVDDRLKSIDLIRLTVPRSLNSSDRLIFHHMHQNFTQFIRQMMLDLGKVDEDSIKRSFEKLYQDLAIAYGPLKEKESLELDWRTVTAKERSQLATKESWQILRRDLEHRTQEVRSDLYAFKRQKQVQVRFFPSTEKAGNIVGTEFPAKVWSLTYDDGPGAGTSKKILDHLNRHGLKATFFQLTKNAKSLSAVSKLIREAGMELASHSYTHRQMTKLSLDQRQWEIATAASELSDLHSRPMKFFRLPYGAGVSNPDIRSRIAKASMIHVFWSVDTLDWMAQSPSEIVARTKKQMAASPRDAGVILFHDIHERTVVASEEIMRYLKLDNRRVCELEKIVEAVNRGSEPCAP